MLKIDMVPSFQINRLCSPCYLAFVTPKRIDAIEQNAGSTLQVPHISKPLRGKHFIQGHHQGVKKTVDEGLRPVSHGSLEFFGKVIGIEHAAPVYKYRSLNNLKYPIETLKHLSACQNICFLSRFPFRFKGPTNKNTRNSPFFLLPVACCFGFCPIYRIFVSKTPLS